MSAAFMAGVAAGYGIAMPVGAIGVLIAGLSARTSLRVGAAAGLGAATADSIYALIAVAGGAAVAGLLTPIATPLCWVAAGVLLLLAVMTARAAIPSIGRRRPRPTSRRSGRHSATAPHTPADEPAAPKISVGESAALQTSVDESAAPWASSGEPAASQTSVDESAAPRASSGEPAASQTSVDESAAPRASVGESGVPRTSADDPSTGRAERPTTALRAYLGVLGLTLLNPATVVYFAALVLGGAGEGGGLWFVAGASLSSASWQLLIAGSGALIGRFLTGDRGRTITALASSLVIAALAIRLL